MKTCFKCNTQKPRSEFYAHKRMADGLLGKCKACTVLDSTIRRANKIEQVQQYDRMRSSLPHRVEGRKEWSRVVRRGAYRAKYNAEVKAGNALRDGKIVRGNCADCGGNGRDMHHEDYSKPLEVVWLCSKCHHARHRKYDYAETVRSRSLVLAA